MVCACVCASPDRGDRRSKQARQQVPVQPTLGEMVTNLRGHLGLPIRGLQGSLFLQLGLEGPLGSHPSRQVGQLAFPGGCQPGIPSLGRLGEQGLVEHGEAAVVGILLDEECLGNPSTRTHRFVENKHVEVSAESGIRGMRVCVRILGGVA